MTSPGRYHLLLATSERPVQHGWWWREDVARDKFRRWVGQYGGSMPGARVILTDEDTGDVLDDWPDRSAPIRARRSLAWSFGSSGLATSC